MYKKILCVVVLIMCVPALGADWSVKLTVQESAGVERKGEPVSGGVPMPMGLVKQPGDVHLEDADGKEVPAQFSAINRWGHDGSVCWLLVQSRSDVKAKGATTFFLKPGKQKAKSHLPLSIKEEGEDLRLTVRTTAHTATIPFKKKRLWAHATLTLKNGEVYRSAPPERVVVEERGPERVVIMMSGRHEPVKPGASLPYCYGYIVRVRWHAGQAHRHVSYTLTNSRQPVIGMPLVKSMRIWIDRAGGTRGEVEVMKGDDWIVAQRQKVWTLAAVRHLKENSPASLALRDVALNPPELVLKPWGDTEQFLDIYSRKTYEILSDAWTGKLDRAACDKKAAAFNNYLRFWPDPKWVSDSRAWGDFGYVAPCDEATAKQLTRRFRPFNMKGYVERRLKEKWSENAWRHIGADPEFESGSSGAPGGGYEPLLKTSHLYLTYLQTGDRRYFDELEKVSVHWRDRRYIHFDKPMGTARWEGSGFYRTHYRAGAKKYAAVQPPKSKVRRHDRAWNYGGGWGPMDTQHFSVDEVVNYYYLTGDRQCLDALDAYGQQAVSFAHRTMGGKGGSVSRAHGWVTRALVSVYEATNDKKFLAAARKAVKYIVDHQDKRIGTISPYDAKETRGRNKGKYARQVPFMAAAVGMSLGRFYRHYPQEDVRDAILGMADWLCYDDAMRNKPPGFSYSWYADRPGGRSSSGHRCMSTMGWAYLATGQKRYMDAADAHAQIAKLGEKRALGYWQINGFGQEYVTLKRSKQERTPLAAVADLAATALGGGKVKLAWTAPGGDRNVDQPGPVAEYQVKHATKEIKERSDWRKKADVEISFWAATNCTGEPKPGNAGAKESYTVEGLTPGTYWFALKSYSKKPNQSDLSNVVKVDVK
jgi:hypothetical protein